MGVPVVVSVCDESSIQRSDALEINSSALDHVFHAERKNACVSIRNIKISERAAQAVVFQIKENLFFRCVHERKAGAQHRIFREMDLFQVHKAGPER
jgi:hypothetical protein